MDAALEEAVLGRLLLNPQRYDDVRLKLHSEVFASPRLQNLMRAFIEQWLDGGPGDVVSIARRADVDTQVVMDLMGDTACSPSLLGRHVDELVAMYQARTTIHALSEAQDRLHAGESIASVIADVDHRAREIASVESEMPDGCFYFDDWACQALTASINPWVIPGVIRAQGRMMIVSTEGGGKSTLCRQIAVCAAHGIHPFNGRDIDPKRVLLVDLENDPTTAYDDDNNLDPASPLALWQTAQIRRPDADRTLFRVWNRQDGIDIRSHRDRQALERILDSHRPDLVVIGPIYKAYAKRAGEDDETLSAGLQQALDQLRVRYGGAWIFEHHAPHGEKYNRQMRPFGSSLWLRWPDIGIAMEPVYEGDEMTNVRKMKRFRGDRYKVKAIPREIRYGTVWPWVDASLGWEQEREQL